ncbi:uncharacterized protein LOC111332625 [Stylophora pistillata]|uniref:uncharacterized protein LOC111332625 n=1 Tax=Stylophora pistillata TaxID=50429 RepID=UPI000C04F9EF|nr:uncharacterized protein LOC111332625 [Stylophora pistillata]
MREVNDYEKLYSLDVLGVEDRGENDQLDVLRDFKEGVVRRHDGRYEVGFPWIPGVTLTNTNEALSRKRLENVERKLSRDKKLKGEYGGIIEEQLRAGVIEEAPKIPSGNRVFYMPHKPIVKRSAVTTKVRMVFNASAKPQPLTYSIIDCMFTGPPLQPLLWDIMVRVRMSASLLLRDIEKAFLQIGVKEEDRDAVRFLFNIKGIEKHLRFTRVPFGVEASPFLLGATLQHHFEQEGSEFEETVRALKENTYVDNLMQTGGNVEKLVRFKEESTAILESARFPVHKWESNVKVLETCCAAAVAVVEHEAGVTKGILTSKSRISKRSTSIARLELVSGHMAVNMAKNLSTALQRWPIQTINIWMDSMVALYWITNPGRGWKMFVSNRVKKIAETAGPINITWKYCPSELNLADLGSRGATIVKMERGNWFAGPDWLLDKRWWPEQPRLNNTKETDEEMYSTKPYGVPATSTLPEYRTDGWRPFEVTGVDFAGPFVYKVSKKEQGKCYVIIFTCASSRAVHLEVARTQTADEFKSKLNVFISRRTRPRIIISGNAKTFKATADWIKTVRRSETELQNYLARENIRRQFNLAKSPWWGGNYERLIKEIKKTFGEVTSFI